MRNPELDGIDHINIYSKARTELGRFLTNFSHHPIWTEDGVFESIEGYWYWLGTDHPEKDKLRKLHGFKAKQIGRELKALDWQDSNIFKYKICKAITTKIKSSEFSEIFKNSKLPFCHYYNYGGKIIEPDDGKWVIEHMENLRIKMNEFEIGDILDISKIGYCGDEALIHQIDKTANETVFHVNTYRYSDDKTFTMEFGFKNNEVWYAGSSIIGGKYWTKANCKISDIQKIGKGVIEDYKQYSCMNNEEPDRNDY